MVTVRTGRRGPTPRGIRGSFDWEAAQNFVNGLAAGASSAFWIVLPSTVRDQYTDPTLYATRLFFSGRSQSLAPAGFTSITFGVIAWDARDDTVPAAPPRPATDANLDWVTRAAGILPTNTPAGTLVSLTFDNTHLSLARRRLGAERGILGVYEAAGVAWDATVDVRCLLRET